MVISLLHNQLYATLQNGFELKLKTKAMKKIITLILTFFTALLNAQTFSPTGISGGGALYAPAINPHNDKLFLICDMGDFYTSTNDGASWQMTNFNELSPDINSEVQFTSSANILYTIKYNPQLGEHYPVKSTDNGITWQNLSDDPTWGNCSAIFCNPNSTTEVIVADAETIYYSNDGGNDFSESYIATSSQIPLYIAGCFWDGPNVYIGTNRGLFVSTDSGVTFSLDNTSGISSSKGFFDFCGSKSSGITRLFGIVADISSLDDSYLDDTDLSGNNEIIQCDYGSTNWEQTFFQTDVLFYRISCASNDISTAYASADFEGAEGRVFKTADGGISWNNKLLTSNNQNITTGWAGEDTEFAWAWSAYPHGITTKSNDPNYVVISDWGFVFKSTDGGDNWQQIYVDQSVQNNPTQLVDESKAYLNNGLMLTSCWNVTWFAQDTIFISYTDITGWRTNDDGNSWLNNDQNNDYNTTYQVINHPSNNIKYAAVSEVHDLYTRFGLTDDDINDGGGAVLYSSDNAQNWDMLKNFNLPVVDIAIDPNNTETMYVATVHNTNGFIYKTTNLSAGATATWTALAAPPRTEGHPYKLNILNDGSIVVSYSGRLVDDEFTASSGIFYSTDGGNTWQDRSHNDMYYWTKDIVVDPHDLSQNTWYACVQDGFTTNTNGKSGVFRTTDRGLSWTNILPNTNAESVTIDPNNADRMFVTTEFNGLQLTDNLSNLLPSFSLVNDYPFFHPMRVAYNPYNQNEIWITSFGNGAYRANQPTLSVSEINPINVMSVYPNPAVEYVHLTSKIITGELFDLSIYDINGRLIFQQKDNYLPRNDLFNIEYLKQGIYFINIQGATFNQTIKIIKTNE